MKFKDFRPGEVYIDDELESSIFIVVGVSYEILFSLEYREGSLNTIFQITLLETESDGTYDVFTYMYLDPEDPVWQGIRRVIDV